MRLNRLQYPGLIGNWGLRVSLEAVIRAAVAAEADLAGLGMSTQAVLLTLRPGSVIVEALINTPNNTLAKIIQTRLNGSERLAKDVLTRVRAITGIERICSGPITMSGIAAMGWSEDEPFAENKSKAQDKSLPANKSQVQDKSLPANESDRTAEPTTFEWGKEQPWWGKYVVAFALSSCGFALVLCLSWPMCWRRASGYSLVSTKEPEIRHETVPRMTQGVKLRPSPVPASKMQVALAKAQGPGNAHGNAHGSRTEQMPLLQSSAPQPQRRS